MWFLGRGPRSGRGIFHTYLSVEGYGVKNVECGRHVEGNI